ncbi:hypothetical protein [Prauserella muralis]|uniref:Uncharacterized protein n=1 Tax=Prauserella muralis TaxID=588067 RepID=A0A2V4ALF0_9PSEU|nr:hypothetical protein [Prauserella muralis]PXY21072.1 hypothetical protein BAY60_26750 [Prauserella muralis]TWE30152.1 hypothetical protein FHX69_2849 [Prauserella muralis]
MAEWFDAFSGGESASSAVDSVFGRAGVFGKDIAGSSGGGGGSWSFDRDQIDAVISQWKALLDDCQQDRMTLQDLRAGDAKPSDDDPSVSYVKDVLEGLGSVRQSNASMLAYIQDFIEKLEAARDGIQRTEDSNADPFTAAKAVFGQ